MRFISALQRVCLVFVLSLVNPLGFAYAGYGSHKVLLCLTQLLWSFPVILAVLYIAVCVRRANRITLKQSK
ncbi:hypothetical protein HWV00_07210 [Moritella sp. 24]|uniref:hypothetical protein n=1 Tax=Moritella sp. 24 TaxID=2746230 RepID=UPI001BA4D8CF|nr:hypothetical protein [Moritella sp. 24]QUM74779.1 hypothetical protein HWV00_07210 [Moritella sp. 24]